MRHNGILQIASMKGRCPGAEWQARVDLAACYRRAQIGAMSCNSPLQQVPQAVLEDTWNNYQPGTRRPYGVMEWPALLRQLDRSELSFRD